MSDIHLIDDKIEEGMKEHGTPFLNSVATQLAKKRFPTLRVPDAKNLLILSLIQRINAIDFLKTQESPKELLEILNTTSSKAKELKT